jgi:bifunctional DNase/RNase
MTHDIFAEIVAGLGGHLRRVEITQLLESTFHARLVLDQAGHEQNYDIRPSDAVALAVRTETPIYVDETVLEQAGIVPGEALSEEGEAAESGAGSSASAPVDESKLSPFREFIETLDIDDLDPGSGGSQKS